MNLAADSLRTRTLSVDHCGLRCRVLVEHLGPDELRITFLSAHGRGGSLVHVVPELRREVELRAVKQLEREPGPIESALACATLGLAVVFAVLCWSEPSEPVVDDVFAPRAVEVHRD